MSLRNEALDSGKNVFIPWHEGVSRDLELINDIHDILCLLGMRASSRGITSFGSLKPQVFHARVELSWEI